MNGEGSWNVAEVCLAVEKRPSRIVVLSSQAAAGPSSHEDHLGSEDDPAHPVSLYGKSKRQGEQAFLRVGKALPSVLLRPVAVYGPRERDIFTIFQIACALSGSFRGRTASCSVPGGLCPGCR